MAECSGDPMACLMALVLLIVCAILYFLGTLVFLAVRRLSTICVYVNPLWCGGDMTPGARWFRFCPKDLEPVADERMSVTKGCNFPIVGFVLTGSLALGNAITSYTNEPTTSTDGLVPCESLYWIDDIFLACWTFSMLNILMVYGLDVGYHRYRRRMAFYWLRIHVLAQFGVCFALIFTTFAGIYYLAEDDRACFDLNPQIWNLAVSNVVITFFVSIPVCAGFTKFASDFLVKIEAPGASSALDLDEGGRRNDKATRIQIN